MKTIKPIDSGKFLAETVEQIDINQLIRQFNIQAKESFIKSQLNIQGLVVKLVTSKTKYGLRFWFSCPICSKRVGKLYKHPLSEAIACRTCNNLDYKSRRFKGMLEQKIVKY